MNLMCTRLSPQPFNQHQPLNQHLLLNQYQLFNQLLTLHLCLLELLNLRLQPVFQAFMLWLQLRDLCLLTFLCHQLHMMSILTRTRRQH